MRRAVPSVEFHRTLRCNIICNNMYRYVLALSHESRLRRRGLHSGIFFLEFFANIVIVSLQGSVNVQTHVIVAAKHACLIKLFLEFNVVQ